MKKPTILKAVLVVLFLIQSSISVAQNVVAYNSNTASYLNTDPTLLGQSIAKHNLKSFVKSDKISKKIVAAVDINPVIKYAQLPYAGQVAVCPNNNKLLPKLFLCGGTDSRLIETGIKDAKSIIWERFISGGSCITVSNSDCANESAAVTCWEKVAIGEDYLANSAGQFRVKIIDKTDTQYVYFFNVYQNTLIPTATTKSDIVKYDIACTINGKITVGGFGSGYEYSFSTTGSPGTWQNSNIFTTSTPGVYTAFIRIKEIVGSCEFKVLNLEIKSLDFSVATEIISPKCSGALGSIRVISSDVKQQYKYKITKPDFTDSSNLTEASEYIFTGLASGTYNVETTVVGSNCMVDSKTVIIAAAPNVIKASARISEELTACNDTGIILLENLSGGTKPYTYSVSIDGAAFVNNGTNKSIITSKSGIYTIRVTDANGCFIDTKVTVPVVDKPIYTVTKSEGSCSNPNGTIKVTIIDAKGYNIQTRINDENYITVDGYIEYPNRAPENYIIRVKYRKGNNGNYCIDTDIPISIGLTTALTASAGVAELSGCGPAGKERQGKVRITNAEGGVPIAGADPYLYSYDGKKTWTTSKEAYVDPGTHVFYVKDANCEIPLDKVILAEKPSAPTIKVDNPAFNCDGTATTTVTVTNDVNSQFKYEYYLDGVLNTNIPTNIFKNVSQGDHTITVSYNVVSVPTESVLLRETFGSGPDVSSPGINAAFCWERQVEATKCNGNKLFGNGEYTVTNSLKNNPYSGWHNPIDNTSKGKDPNGRYLAVDAGEAIPNNAVLYRKTIKDIIPNQPVKVTFVATNLLKIGNNQPDASLTVELQDANGVVLPGPPQSTGGIPKTNGWVEYTKTVNPGNNTTLDFVLRLELSQVNGIDFAVDDIVVTQMPKSCNTTANFPLVVDGSKAFAASITGYKDVQCIGETNGEITLSAKNFDPVKGFQYQVGTGIWQTVKPSPAATSGSITLKNLPSGIYNIKIRYDNTASSCTFPVSQEIKNPAVLKIQAEVTTKATCVFGATITAKAEGGTPAYEYELRQADGTTLVQPFQDSGIFTNVAVGDYTVIAKDLNSCQSAVLAEVKVVAAVAPVAVFEPSDLCFDSTAEFKIKVTGGVGPYTYTTIFNDGTKSNSSATFNGPILTYTVTNAGKYEFEITDSYGCKTNVLTETISAKLITVTPVTTPLDCDVAPANEAVITGTITGGKAPFVVTITAGSNAGTLVQPTAIPSTKESIFTYSTAVSGNYEFKITDANNCTTTSKAIIAALNPITLGSKNINPKCNGDSNGSVTLIPGGGSGVYTYSKDGVLYDNTILYTGLKAGIEYTFYVKDGNSCTKSITVTLVNPAVISGSASITTPYTCDGPATITVGAIVTGGNGIFKYTLNRNGVAVNTVPQDSKIFSGITIAGNYTVTINDSNGCTFTTTPALSIVALNKPAAMTLTPSAVTCPDNTATVTITDVKNAAGTIIPTTGLQYRMVLPTPVGAYQTFNVFTGLAAGKTYKFEVKDATNCTFEKSITIDALPTIVVDVKSSTDISCLGSIDGSAVFTVKGLPATTLYGYTLVSIPAGFNKSGSGTATGGPFELSVTGLNAASYKLTITNTTTACTGKQDVIIAAPAFALGLDPTVTTNVTCRDLGTAEIKAKGGWGSYTYVVKTAGGVIVTAPAGTPKNKYTNLAAGVYNFTVTDLKGCETSGTFTIADKVYPKASIDASSNFCVGTTGATLVATPDIAPQSNYRYSLNGSLPAVTSGTFSNLTPGKYTITVSDIATGCSIDLPEQTIAAPITASIKIAKDFDCTASADASIEVYNIANGYPEFNYRVSTTAGSFTGASVPVGIGNTSFNYTVTATTAATYYFEITDSKGCKTVVSQKIKAKVLPTADTTPTNPTCFGGSNGSITVNASLGLPPYTYEVSTTSATAGFTPMASKIYPNASADIDYWFRVTDSKNCQFVTLKRTLSNPAELTASAALTTSLTCGPANATQSATITVTVLLPGTPFTGVNKYRYSYNSATPVTSNTYTTSTSGPVSVVVYDANGCSYTVPTSPVVNTLNAPTAMTFAAANTITCDPAKLDTDLTVSFSNGVAPFKVEITATDSAVTPSPLFATGVATNSYTFTNLFPGKYSFKITDANNCTTTEDYEIEKVVGVTVSGSILSNVICKGSSDGKLTFTVSGNAGIFDYELKNSTNAIVPKGQSTQTGNDIVYTGLAADTYTITITNPTTKCTATKSLEVKEPQFALAIGTPIITPITCAPNNGKVVIVTTGGWGNNRYTLTQPDLTVVGPQASATFGNLTQSGSYGISVTDLNGDGCPVTGSFIMAAKVSPSASIDLLASDLCYDSVGKATIVVTPTAVSPDYRYNINDGVYQVSGTFSGLNTGNYVVKVKDIITGCILELPAQFIETELKFEAKLSKAANCLTQDTEIKGTVSGGKAPYSYTVTKNGTVDATIIPVTGTTFTYTDTVDPPLVGNTTYLFTLTDSSNGLCNLPSTVIVAPRTKPEFTATPNSTILCNGAATGSITVVIDPSKGVSPYVIDVYNKTTLTSYGTKTTGLPAGEYKVRVTDDKGCFTEIATGIIIKEPLQIQFTEAVVNMTCVGAGVTYGSISVTNFTGGSSETTPTGPFTYTLTNNVGDPTQVADHAISDIRGDYKFDVLKFGIYQLTVSDKNGCSVTKTITMASRVEDLKIDVAAGPLSCTSASLVVSVDPLFTGGPYHFALYPIVSGSSPAYEYASNMASYQNADSPVSTAPALPDLYLQSTFTNLIPGVTYSFIVYDEATDCYYFRQADAPTKTASTLTSVITPANVTCQGEGNGNVSFTIAGTKPTTTSVKYEVYNSQTNVLVAPSLGGTINLPTNNVDNLGPLVPGTYYILFTELDATNTVVCLNSSTTFAISESVVPLTLLASAVKNDNCGFEKGIIEAFGQGGSTTIIDPIDPTKTIPTPYLYQVFPDTGTVGVIDGSDLPVTDAGLSASFDTNGQTSNTFNVNDGNYLVYVKDANGCIQVQFVTVILDPSPEITAVVNSVCATEGSFVIDVDLTTTGIGTHYYSLDGADFVAMPATPFSIVNLSSGNHTVAVKDFNGCGMTVTLPLISEPLVIKASFTTVPNCTANDGEITAEVTGGFLPNNFEYTLVNNTVPTIPNIVQSNDPVFVGQAAGNYTITVKDLNTNCSLSTTVDLLVPTVVDLIAADIATTPVDCSGTQGTNDNGTLTVNLRAVNDNPDYTYTLTPVLPLVVIPIVQVGNNYFTGLSAGDYTVTVKSSRGCEAIVSANVPAPSAVVVTATATPFSCAIDPTVTTVVVEGLGGSGSYTFSKNGVDYFTSNNTPPDNKYTFDIADNGSIQDPTYWVKDSNGCIQTNTLVTALDPLPKLISVTATRSLSADSQIDCANGREFIQIDVIGGSTPSDFTYDVSIDGGTYTNLTNSAGTPYNYSATTAGKKYQFRITDNVTGCEILSNIYDVPLFNALDVVASTVSDVQCISESNGSIQVNISGYSGVYNYALYDGTTAVVGVGASGSHDTATSNPFVIPFGLSAGANYTVKITEVGYPKCSVDSNALIISEPAAALALDPLVVTPLGCTTDGAVTITAKDGWGDYTYTLTQGATVKTNTLGTFDNLTVVGTYNISVKDANGCEVLGTFELFTPIEPTATIDVISDYCYDEVNKATLVVTASSTSPFIVAGDLYEYSIDNGQNWQSSNTFPGLSPGDYNVRVKDKFGCVTIAASTVNTTINGQFFASAQNNTDILCGSVATVDGSIKVSAVGGYPGYSYTVTKDGGTPSAVIAFTTATDTFAIYPVTAQGSYVFTVYDSKGCNFVTTIPVVMKDPTVVLFTTTPTSPSCMGTQGELSDGSILVTLDPSSVDNPDYIYTIVRTNPTGFTKTQVNNGLFTGLTIGDYDVTVTSGRDCATTKQEVIAEPIPVVATATAAAFTCSSTNTLNNTVVTVTGTGGVGTNSVTDYTYSEDGVDWKLDNTFNVSDDPNGNTQNPIYYVKDANGCIDDVTIAIAPFPKLIAVVATNGPAIDCNNLQQEMNVVISGGTNTPNAFTYNVYQDGVKIEGPTAVFGNTFTYNATSVGSYYEFEVFDNNTGCSIKSIAYDVPIFNKMKVNATTASNVDCNGNATGAIEINIVDYAGPYTYEILKGGVSLVPAITGSGDSSVNSSLVLSHGLVSGNDYTVVVTENGYPSCTVTSDDVSIKEPTSLDLVNFDVIVKNQNCNNVGATLTVDETTISGGTPGFSYAFVPAGTPVTDADYKGFTSMTFATTATTATPDQIKVYVKDANGCFAFKTFNISQDPMPVITKAEPTQCPSATGTYDITVTATGFTADLEYSLDGNTWQLNNSTLTVQTTGDHTVYVRDANKCVVTEPVNILEPLQLLFDLTTVPTCTDADGVVTLTASGGSVPANYQYSQDGTNYVASNVFGTLAPRATPYTFYVKDMGTLCTKSVDVLIENPNQVIDFSLAKTDVICNGENNGTITVNMDTPTTTVNNNPVYTYVISPSPVGVVLEGNVFKNLPQGNYTVTVTSGRGCPSSKSETVGEPAPIVVAVPTVSEYGCTTGNGTNDATISVPLPTGGSNVYTVYEFLRDGNPIPVQRGDNPIYTETDLLGGTYVINVYDDKGCLATATATINPFVGIDFATTEDITVTKAITCIDTEDIQVNVVFTSGAAVPLVYTIEGTATNAIAYPTQTNANGIFTNLTVGSYEITVANPITGCSIKAIHYVNEPNTFNIVASNVQNVICYGSATGSAVLTFVDNQTDPTDDAGPFEYTITGPNGSTPVQTTAGVSITIPNLPAGVYNVKAKLVNTPSCEVETNFTIAGPTAELEIFATATPITCDPGDDGTIAVTADGGWPGIYQYELVGPVSVPYSDQFYFENLIPGTYTVNVKDAGGCIDTEIVILKNPDPIVVTASATATTLACNGAFDGEIVVALPTGGQGTNYAYILNYVSANPMFSSTPQSSPVFSGLGAGTYSVTVVDGLNCVSQPTANIVIGEPTKVEPTLSLETGVTCLTQATLTLSATGGKGPYEYSEDQNFVIVSGSFVSEVTFSVGLGDHQYYVRDANNCVSFISNNVTINALTPLDLNLDLSNADVKCTGSASGVIDASAVGGLGNYLYTLLDASKVAIRPTQSTGYFDLLLAGTYIVRVDSGDCQFDSGVVTISEPLLALTVTPLITNVTCNSNKDGKITIDASGGTGAISYAISPNLNQFFEGNSATGHVFDNLRAGNYEVLVTDENGCFVSLKNITITEPDDLIATIIPNSIREEVCQGDNDGAFSIDIEGGTAPYQISLDNFKGVYTTVTTLPYDFTGLSGGKHTVYVKDALNCTTDVEIVFEEAVILNPKAVVTYDCVNNASANVVTITIDDSNDPADVDYDLDGTGVFQPSGIFTNVAPGKHFVIARHGNGCEKRTIEFEVIAVAPLTLTLSDGQLNQIVATATGGSGDYEYSFNSESFTSSSNYVYYKSDVYTVTVRDKNGCTATASRQFDYVDVCIPNYFTPNGDGNQDTWGPGCSINYTDLVYTIFDRYGREIAKYRFGQKWDGTYKGAALPTGDYWYVVKLNNPKDDREFVGHFTLYR